MATGRYLAGWQTTAHEFALFVQRADAVSFCVEWLQQVGESNALQEKLLTAEAEIMEKFSSNVGGHSVCAHNVFARRVRQCSSCAYVRKPRRPCVTVTALEAGLFYQERSPSDHAQDESFRRFNQVQH